MMRLEMQTCNTILTEKQQKYQHHNLQKLSMNILQLKNLFSNQRQIIEKLSWHILLQEKPPKNKEKQLKRKGKKRIDAITNQKEIAALNG